LRARDWTLTVRAGSKVEHERHDSLEQAIDALAARLDELAPGARREEQRFFARRIEPIQQVAARLELAGPRGPRGGVDLRGDGSSEAFSGRLRRRVIERRQGESAAHALRRVLST
jgi:translation elongation factor EF-Tu-like GTPase